MKKFNQQENQRIWLACNSIRASIFLSMVSRRVEDAISKLGQGSVIFSLIQQYNWKELFENETWLNVLEGAQNFNSLDGRYKDQLLTIIEFFPEQTEEHIFPELL